MGYIGDNIKKNQYIIIFIVFLVGICVARWSNVVKANEEPVALTLQPKYQVSETALATGENESVARPGSSDNPYMITSVEDMINLQDYSKTNDCQGMYFEVDERLKNNTETDNTEDNPQTTDEILEEEEDGNVDLETPYDLDLTDENFLGIGQKVEYPFRGHIDFNGVTVKVDTNIFYIVSGGASIKNVNILGDINNKKNNQIYNSECISDSSYKNDLESGVSGLVYLAYGNDSGESGVNIEKVNIVKTSSNSLSTIIGGTQCSAGIIAKVVNRNTNDNSHKFNIVIKDCIVKASIKGKGYYKSEGYCINSNYVSNINKYLFDSEGMVGGIIGQVNTYNYSSVRYTYVELSNCSVEGELVCDEAPVGGVIGNAWRATYIDIKNSLDVSKITKMKITNNNKEEYMGYILGGQLNSIVNKYKDCNIVEPKSEELNNIADIGMQYKSTKDRTPANLYNGLETLKDRNIKGNGTNDSPYIIEDCADLAILSVIFCSEGRFWLDKFENKPSNYYYVRTANYKVTKDIDMQDYNLCRINDISYGGGFAGTFKGDKGNGEKPIIDFGNMDTRQGYVSLWGFVSNDGLDKTSRTVEFSNLILKGDITTTNDASGLLYACRNACDNSEVDLNFIFRDIDNQVNITKKYKSTHNGYIGGFIATTNRNNYSMGYEFDNVTYSGDITIENADTYQVFVGGLIGRLERSNKEGSIVEIDGYHYKGNLTVNQTNNNTYAGATIGYVDNTNTSWKDSIGKYNYWDGSKYIGIPTRCGRHRINIKNTTYGEESSETADEYRIYSKADIGGILGREWNAVDVSINNININNIDMTVENDKSCGGLLSSATGRIVINRLNFNNFNIINRRNTDNNTVLVVRWFTEGIIDITGLEVNNTKINSKSPHDIALYTDNRYGDPEQYIRALISINGVAQNGKPYSAFNGYEPKADYIYEGATTMSCRGSFFYNVFQEVTKTIDESGKDQWTIESIEEKYPDGYIEGAGTAESPIIIDKPEKLVIYSAMTNTSFRSMDLYFKYFKEYKNIVLNGASDTQNVRDAIEKLLCGYVVFASDLNMTNKNDPDNSDDDYGYSYNPIQVYGGHYYGFDAVKYLKAQGKSTPTSNEILQAYQKAITILDGGTADGITLDVINSYKPTISMDATQIHKYNSKIGSCATLNYYNPNIYDNYNNIRGTSGRYSSLFTHIKCNSVNISNICLDGNYYYCALKKDNRNGDRTGGALVGQFNMWQDRSPWYADIESIYDANNVKISHIDIKDVKVECNINDSVTKTKGVGLLIADIKGNSKVNIDNVKILDGSNVRADALIGYQDGSNTQTTLTNIDLNNAIDNTINETDNISNEPKENYKDQANKCGLKYGLFYYNLSEGSALYNYDQDIQNNIIYSNNVVTPSVKIEEENHPQKGKYKVNSALLENKSYAYKQKGVIVNIILEDITQGTGIKDDPYILTNVKQLLTLSYCFESGGANTPAGSWYVGNDPSNKTNNKAGDVNHLRTAYYQLGNDIDFTASNLENSVKNSANTFVGIGTRNYPFSGHLDGDNKTITLPNFNGVKVIQYGLFYYTAGIYAKDLTLKTAQNKDVNVTNAGNAYVGMLSAYSEGGDSVVENVKIEANVKVDGANVSSSVAGYFGRMDYGSLTMIGNTHDNLKDFKVYYGTNTSVAKSSTYINAVTGQVRGGAYIVQHNTDDNITSAQQFIYNKDSDTISDTGLRYTNYVSIINDKFLQDAGKLVISKATDDSGNEIGGYYVDVANEKQLYILSLGIASGSLSSTSVYQMDYWPYRSVSSTWKSSSCWGNASSQGDTWGNEELVNSAGNSLQYPSILQYFDESDNNGLVSIDNYYIENALIFNKDYFNNDLQKASKYNGDNNDERKYNVTYRLTKNQDEQGQILYDMSTLDFRGISSADIDAFSNWDYIPGAFAANIVGNTYTVTEDDKSIEKNTLIKLNINTVGSGSNDVVGGFIPLLGGKWSNVGAVYNIKNISLTGNVTAKKFAGGLIGHNYSNASYVIENVNISDMNIKTTKENGSWADSSAGGVIGRSENRNYHTLELKNVVGNDINVTANNSSGLVVGMYRDAISIHDIVINHSKCTYEAVGKASNGFAGGVVGTAYGFDDAKDITMYNISISNSEIQGKSRAGGVIGYMRYYTYTRNKTGIYNILLDNVSVTRNDNNNYLGKIIGDIYTENPAMEIGILNCRFLNQLDKFNNLKYIGSKGKPEGSLDYNIVLLDVKDIKDLDTSEEDPIVNKYKPLVTNSILNGLDLIPDNIDNNTYIDNNLIKWTNDAGNINTIVNSVLNNLTNTTGLYNGGNKRDDDTDLNYNNNIDISIIPMKVVGGVAQVADSKEGKLNIIKGDSDYTIKITGFNTGDVDDNDVLTPNTYTIIQVKYGITHSNSGESRFSEVINIPIYIDQTINVDMYSRVNVGRKINVSSIKNSGQTNLNVTEDSCYTLYTEYTYSSTRKASKIPLYMEKEFTLDETNQPVIPLNTELTLVDISEGEIKTYYYKVKDNGIRSIPLTDFKDENNNSFKERNIADIKELKPKATWITFLYNGNKYRKKECGVEQLFIYVDGSKIEKSEGEIALVDCKPSIIVKEEDVSASEEQTQNLFKKTRCYTQVYNYSGQKISFKESKASITLDNGTDSTTSEGSEVQWEQSSSVSNKLNKNTKVTMSATISNKASEIYWKTVRKDDYSNKDKYLEVAMYLVNSEGKRELLPNGTKVKIGKSETSAFAGIKNTSNIYYFKDSDNPFALNNIIGANEIPEGLTIETPLDVALDFSFADFTTLPVGRYKVCFELVRIQNPDYPMGEETLSKIYTDEFQVIASAEYGFRYDIADDDNLAYNKGIDGDNKTMNLKMLLNSTLPEDDNSITSIEIRYQIYSKVKNDADNSYSYRAYRQSDVEKLKLKVGNDNVDLSMSDGEITKYIYNVSKDSLPKKEQPNLEIPIELSLSQKTDCTNYKLVGEIYVNGIKESSDYIVFNVSDIQVP